MISQPTQERTARTERRARVRRGIKKRGILPSFGDIVLPVVSVAAVALLLLAGRQFFLKGVQTSPEVTSTRAYADAPAVISERERAEIPPVEVAKVEPEPATEPVQVKTPEPVLSEVAPPVASVPPVTPAPKKAATPPAPKPAPAPAAKPAPAPQKSSTISGLKNNIAMSKQWRVQVGAYGSKSGAQDAAKKINNSGFQAEVYSNPASKYTKVWVKGGTDKATAEKVADAMKAMGFKGSFVFPPAATK